MAQLFLPEKYRDPVRLIRELRSRPERYWVERGEARVLKLFHEMARRVPAYKDFLRRHRINSLQIKTINEFREVPTVDKNNYLRFYPLEKLCWDGIFEKKNWVISTTSGSTGIPFYFPREDAQDFQYAGTAELYLRTNFEIHKKSTLYVDAFPMGAWIGGLFTYQAIKLITERGNYQLSIITPGIDKKEIINCVKKFGKEFNQIIIGCYGPFLKDALDEGSDQGIDWTKYNLKFVFSAEGFTEAFRDYIIKRVGLKNPYKDTLNHYGTVDQGTLAHETPLSILIRRLAVRKQAFYSKIFPTKQNLPTLCQYDPELFFFEEVASGLLCSSYSGLPLVRYDLKDHGGIMSYVEMMGKVADAGVNLKREIKRAKIGDTLWQLPFVYVYERSDFSVSLYAFQIYPETIRKALLARKFHPYLTGKFTMLVKYDSRQNQLLEIDVELRPNRKETKKLADGVRREVTRYLLAENSEYRKTYSEIPDRVRPHIVFWQYEHTDYFNSRGKQKWVKK